MPIRSIFIYVVAVVSIVGIAVMWFVMRVLFGVYHAIGTDLAWALDVDTARYQLVDTFMGYVAEYIIVVALLVLIYWSFQYAQRRGERVYV